MKTMMHTWLHQQGVNSLNNANLGVNEFMRCSALIGFWRPFNDRNPYWQVDLGQNIPIYAVKILGDKATKEFVTSYEIRYSYNNAIFYEAKDSFGNTKVNNMNS
jgi:F5/8 type C domain